MSRILRPEGLSGVAITEITCELMLRIGRRPHRRSERDAVIRR